MTPLNPSGHLETSEAAVRPGRKSKTTARKTKRRVKTAVAGDDDLTRPAVGTLSRTKSLLLAALRVWELKNGFRD